MGGPQRSNEFMQRLFGRTKHKSLRCSRRIKELAKPVPRFQTPKYKHYEKRTRGKRIDSLWKRKCSTRLKQLAAPPLRCLVENRTSFDHILNYRKKRQLDKLIRTRKFNMYSRLTNTDINMGDHRRSWTKEDWKRHNCWLAKKARPKKYPEPPEPPTTSKPLSELVRFKKLALPRHPLPPPPIFYKDAIVKKGPEYVKASALTYQITENVKKLAEPKSIYEKEDYEAYFAVKEGAKNREYKASKRTIDLSKHRELGIGEYILDKGDHNTLGKVKKEALSKANTNSKIKKLAQPKPAPEKQDFEACFKVSTKALAGKASARTIELAQPKARQ